MSLLLDALKKAEQRQFSADQFYVGQQMQEVQERSAAQWSGLLSVQDALQGERLSSAFSPRPNVDGFPLSGVSAEHEAASAQQATAVRNVFAVKKTSLFYRVSQGFVWGMVMLLVAVIMGVWFWWQLQIFHRPEP